MDQEKIGKFIAELRKEKNLTQEQLGEKLGVTHKAISKWENGKCLPDPSLYKPLCSILGINLTEFFNGEKIVPENTIQKTDEVLYEMVENKKRSVIIQMVSTIFLVIAITLLFIPSIKRFDITLSIITISIALFLLCISASLKLTEWKRINNKVVKNTGMGFSTALTLIFITLKLTKQINWSWIWIFSPIWITILGIVILLLVGFIIFTITDQLKKRKNNYF